MHLSELKWVASFLWNMNKICILSYKLLLKMNQPLNHIGLFRQIFITTLKLTKISSMLHDVITTTTIKITVQSMNITVYMVKKGKSCLKSYV